MKVIEGDYGYDLNFTITDSSSNALDLTDSTITLKVARANSTSNLFTGTCTNVVAASGTCKYTVEDGDMATQGIYDWELQVAYSTKIVTAKGSEQIEILKQLP